MSVVSAFLSGTFTNTTISADDASNGRRWLYDTLFELQERLPGQREEIENVADTMRIAVGGILRDALNDFEKFIAAWHFEVRVWKSMKETNIIVIRMRERNDCPREHEFRFSHLQRL